MTLSALAIIALPIGLLSHDLDLTFSPRIVNVGERTLAVEMAVVEAPSDHSLAGSPLSRLTVARLESTAHALFCTAREVPPVILLDQHSTGVSSGAEIGLRAPLFPVACRHARHSFESHGRRVSRGRSRAC